MITLIYPILLLLSTLLDTPKEQYSIQAISTQIDIYKYKNPKIFGDYLVVSAIIPRLIVGDVYGYYRLYKAPIIGGPLIDDFAMIETECDHADTHLYAISNNANESSNEIFYNKYMPSYPSGFGTRESKIGIFSGYYDDDKIQECQQLDFCDIRHSYLIPTLSSDGLRMIFSSDLSGKYRPYEVRRKNLQTKWSTPVQLKGISIHFKHEAILFPNWIGDNEIAFSANAPNGLGGLDIYKSRYQNGRWTTPLNWSSLNSEFDDYSVEMASQNSGYFTSDRNEWGEEQIYYFEIIE